MITGATGFVGSHIAEAFVGAGYRVRCGVRATSDTRWISDLPVELVPLDLSRPEDFDGALEGADVVVHAAGITRAQREEDYFLVNAEGTRRLAEAAAGSRVRRFVLIGSLAARGPDGLARVDGRDHPESAYGRSKLEAEAYLHALDERIIDTVALRPVAIYGPRDTDFLPLLKMACRGFLVLSGEGLLQPVYATDVARAALAAARKPVGFGPYPVAESASYSWQDVTAGLEAALGRRIHVVRLPAAAFELAGRAAERVAKARGSVPIFDERRARDLTVHTWTCDPSGTERALGWRAEVSLVEGLNLTARWYQKAGWL